MYLEFNKTNVLKQGILISCKIKKLENVKMKAVKLNDDNVYSGVRFLNLKKRKKNKKIRIFIEKRE